MSGSLTLGADAWTVLSQEAPILTLPHPFGADTFAPLTPAQRDAVERAIRTSPLCDHDDPALLAALAPPVRAALLVHARPGLTVDLAIGLGRNGRAAHLATSGPLLATVARDFSDAGEAGITYGPVELSLRNSEELVTITSDFLDLPDEPVDPAEDATDPAEALAAVSALEDGRPELADAILHGAVPDALSATVPGLDRVARIAVSSAAGTRFFLLLRAGDRWWSAMRSGNEFAFSRASRGTVAADVALLFVNAPAGETQL